MLGERKNFEFEEQISRVDKRLNQTGEEVYASLFPIILLMDQVQVTVRLGDVATIAAAATAGGLIGSHTDKKDRLTGFAKGSAVGTYVGCVVVIIINFVSTS